ncbi:MAG: thiamine phosphate synthase [Elusimicrobiota bacterium]
MTDKLPDKGIYFLFDPATWRKQPWMNTIQEILPNISMIQLRSPGMDIITYRETASELKEIIGDSGIPIIINNRIEVAVSLGLNGIHLGAGDMPVGEARKIFKGIIGASRHTPSGAKEAEAAGADYIGCGPVFPTRTKLLDRPVIGIDGFIKVKESVSIPVIPIGGIDTENVNRLAGISGVLAVSAAINLSENPGLITEKLNSNRL